MATYLHASIHTLTYIFTVQFEQRALLSVFGGLLHRFHMNPHNLPCSAFPWTGGMRRGQARGSLLHPSLSLRKAVHVDTNTPSLFFTCTRGRAIPIHPRDPLPMQPCAQSRTQLWFRSSQARSEKATKRDRLDFHSDDAHRTATELHAFPRIRNPWGQNAPRTWKGKWGKDRRRLPSDVSVVACICQSHVVRRGHRLAPLVAKPDIWRLTNFPATRYVFQTMRMRVGWAAHATWVPHPVELPTLTCRRVFQQGLVSNGPCKFFAGLEWMDSRAPEAARCHQQLRQTVGSTFTFVSLGV